MREREPYAVLAGLVEDGLDGVVETILGLVHIDHGGGPLRGIDGRALKRRLREHGDEEATEQLATFGLEQILGGGDQDDLPLLHRLE